MTSINQARLKAIGQSYIKPTGWYCAHSLAEHATVNSFELWIKVSVGDDRLISDLATISATIRHITSVSVVQVLTSDHWSFSYRAGHFKYQKKKSNTNLWRRRILRLKNLRGRSAMYTNTFNRKHSTIRQMLDRLLDPTKKSIRRSESVCSSSSTDSLKSYHGTFGRCYTLTHSHRGNLPWSRK